jgi:hypothetical protein
MPLPDGSARFQTSRGSPRLHGRGGGRGPGGRPGEARTAQHQAEERDNRARADAERVQREAEKRVIATSSKENPLTSEDPIKDKMTS